MASSQTLEVPGYQVVQFIGTGAGSTIWQVRNRRTDQIYALKRVLKRTAEAQRYLDQAINEYEIGSKLSHPVLRNDRAAAGQAVVQPA